MTSNKALFLAGVCGAVGVLGGVGELMTGVHVLALISTIALVPGIVLLVIAYTQLVRAWRARRSQPRIDVYLFALTSEEETTDE